MRLAALLVVAVLVWSIPVGTESQDQKPVLYVIATSHLDSQWNWTVQDSIRRFVPATFLENFDRFEKFPNYVFSYEGAIHYMRHTAETDRVFPHHYTLENGLMHPGDAPGLGVDIDETLAAKYPYQPAYLPVNRLEDGTMHDW